MARTRSSSTSRSRRPAAPRGKATAAPAAKKGRRKPSASTATAAASTSTHPPKQRDAATLRLIDRVRAICLALPDTTEKESWGEPTWRVGGRIFVQFDTYHHGSPHVAVWLPAPPGAQEGLIESDPDRYFRPAYVGHRGWVGVVLETAPDWGQVASLIEIAYELIRARGARR